MTPQEKAKEIYCKYADALNIRDLQITANPFAKQCALIAAIEMIQISNEAMLFKQSKREWLQEVKQEIIKL
jgi:hypothetical protein